MITQQKIQRPTKIWTACGSNPNTIEISLLRSIPNQFQLHPNQNDFGLKQSSPFFTDKLLQLSIEKRNKNHLSCKRDVCPCQNSKSSGLSLYPPQNSGFGIKLLSKHKKFTKDLKANFSPGVISFSFFFN